MAQRTARRCREHSCGQQGDKKQLLNRANDNAKQSMQRSKMSRISDMGARTTAMNDVAKALGLEQAPLRIECYDISNTVGGALRSLPW